MRRGWGPAARVAGGVGRSVVRSVALVVVVALVMAPVAARAQQAGVDALRYRFAIELPPRGADLDVTATLAFTRAREVAALHLDLLAPMRVRGATVGCQRPVGVRPTHDGRVVTIPLPPARAEGELLCVTLRYHGAPRDGLIVSTDSAGRWMAFGDNWPDRARHWLATIDHPSDKAQVEFVVDAPADRRVIANGTERGRAVLFGGRHRTTWMLDEPIPTYLMVIAAAPLAEHDLGATACGLAAAGGCVPQVVFTAPEQAAAMPGAFAQADDIVSYFARTVGPFPYPQLQHLQSSTRFGGMENAGAIFYADRLFREPAGVGDGLIAHETAHQWFGDAVTEAAWGHVWLSEGFATYFAALYAADARGDTAFRAERVAMRDAVRRAPVTATRPVLDTAQTDLLQLLNSNSYQKGGFVLHMLRQEVGDRAFFAAIRAYHAAHRHGTALTADLRTAMEREAGRDLGWFFDQWLTRPGLVEGQVSWRYDAAAQALAVTVVQDGRFPPYAFPLTLGVEGSDGTTRLVTVRIPAAREVIVLATDLHLSRAPRMVVVDPRADLLHDLRAP